MAELEFNNTTLLYGLFNQYVFSEAKMNIEYLMMYYKDKYIYQSNTLVKGMLDLIKNHDYKDLTESRFLLMLQSDNRTTDEAQLILNKIKEYRSYEKDQADVFIENLRQLCSTAWIDRCKNRYEADSVEFIKAVQSYNYKSNYSDTLVAKSFGQLDLTDLVSRYTAQGFKSRYDFINNTFTIGEYIPGQLVVVAGAPSTGKSLFIEGEAVNFIKQGKRVHMLVMGDLNELDLATRMMCMMSGKSQREIESDIIGNFNQYKDIFKDYLTITCVPSGAVSAREYVDWMLQRIDEYDVLMIDYYSNFAQDDNRSMYTNGGDICDALTELTRKGKLVFLAAQPNKSYWSDEWLPYDCIGESSRIQHIADMIITIGRRWEAGMPMGKINLGKNRKGTETAESNYIRTNDGLFYPCSDALYIKYRSNKQQRHLYSYAELKMMDIIDESITGQLTDTLETKEEEK